MHNGIKLTALFIWALAGVVSVDADAQNSVNKTPTLTKSIPKNVSEAPINIGSRLELFIDRYIIEELAGEAKVVLHHPTPQEMVMEHDEPWEGSGSGYHTVFEDDGQYRMYYKSYQNPNSRTATQDDLNILSCAYAESADGINWVKPNLRIHDFEGSKNNNVIFVTGDFQGLAIDAGHPAVFKDENPDVSKDALYKAILRAKRPTVGLYALKSPDGIHWQPISKEIIISDGYFDSQNLAFWDPNIKKYRAYWRFFDQDEEGKRVRSIRTATSENFVDWDNYQDLKYQDNPQEQLYTNQVKPYYRAPHIYVGFPARYIDRGWSESMRMLPELEDREYRSSRQERFGTALTETLLMASRDGVLFHKWNEAFIRPGPERKGSWTYGDAYTAWQMVETKSALEGAPNELSLYVTEQYWNGTSSALRRYTLRIDGFASVYANMKGGALVTKPIAFSGDNLFLNFSSSAAGEILVELLDEDDVPIPDYTLEDCEPIFGDALERKVSWKGNRDVSSLAGKTIKLRFTLKDADLFSFQFK